jgi:hypothetical protein
MYADQFADSASCRGARISSGLDGPDISSNEDSDIPGANILATHKHHIGSLDHCVGGLDGSDESFGLDHAERFNVH